MNVLIIEDEQSAGENLAIALKKIKPDVIVKGICRTSTDAIEAIKIYKPDLIFLDIQLDNNSSGFEVLNSFKNPDFKVIFTTSYKKHALAAFDYNAVHFLLKPFSDEKLNEAIKRAELISLGEQYQKIEELKTTNNFLEKRTDRFTIKANNGDMFVVNYKDILYLEAEGSYVNIICIGPPAKLVSTNKSLTDYENILKFREFTRISQKRLVNNNYIKKYLKPSKTKSLQTNKDKTEEGAGGYVELTNKIILPVSRRLLNELKEVLHIF